MKTNSKDELVSALRWTNHVLSQRLAPPRFTKQQRRYYLTVGIKLFSSSPLCRSTDIRWLWVCWVPLDSITLTGFTIYTLCNSGKVQHIYCAFNSHSHHFAHLTVTSIHHSSGDTFSKWSQTQFLLKSTKRHMASFDSLPSSWNAASKQWPASLLKGLMLTLAYQFLIG